MMAAAVCGLVWVHTGNGLWAALARASAWLNVLNLIPVLILDGGQAAYALSKAERLTVLLVAVALGAATREGVFFFQNQGHGNFIDHAILEFPPVWGSTGLQLVDFNNDGFPDLLVVNGDNGEYASPTKNFHGIRLYLNDGQNHFKEAWSFPLNGAFKAIARDCKKDDYRLRTVIEKFVMSELFQKR